VKTLSIIRIAKVNANSLFIVNSSFFKKYAGNAVYKLAFLFYHRQLYLANMYNLYKL